jgi:catechol 2,3-dioxygenase-like lactoylglutathione lyase family enzyme
MIQAMNHVTVLAQDLGATVDFYVSLLGLRQGPRPDLGFPGAWLYAGEQAVLHVVAGRPLPEPRAGVIDHVAFSARGLAQVKAGLEARGLPITLRRLPGSGAWQLFCHDPNGARVELDFDADEAL